VIPNFVAGVEMAAPHGFATVAEALDSTGEGLAYFMRQGIVPRFTTWCAEPLSELGRAQGPAPLDYHAGLLRVWRDTHARYRLPAPPGYGPPGVGRAVFSVSAFMDVIDPRRRLRNSEPRRQRKECAGWGPRVVDKNRPRLPRTGSSNAKTTCQTKTYGD